jgi:hypothetical protein
MTGGGCLGVEGHGKAPHWRLTEIGYMREPPTRDFLRWNGAPFHSPEKQNPVRKNRTGCPKKPDITVYGKTVHLGPNCPEKPDIRAAQPVRKNRTYLD